MRPTVNTKAALRFILHLEPELHVVFLLPLFLLLGIFVPVVLRPKQAHDSAHEHAKTHTIIIFVATPALLRNLAHRVP